MSKIKKMTCSLYILAALSTAHAAYAGECEGDGAANAAASSIISAQTALLNAHYRPPTGILPKNYRTRLDTTQKFILNELDIMEAKILAKMREVWLVWFDAMKDSAAEINAGAVSDARTLGSIMDSDIAADRQRLIAKKELEAKTSYTVSDQTCRFDTAGTYLGNAKEIGKAYSTALSNELQAVSANNKYSIANQGAQTFQRSRWQAYATKFCDGISNGGRPGCVPGQALANAHVLPGKTLFAKETIDLTNPDLREAVRQLIYNITSFSVSDPVDVDILKSSEGKENNILRRSRLARSDAISALGYDIVGERTPGPAAPEIQSLRQKNGALDASDHPSDREIRQSVIDQIQDPGYYADLIDGSATVAQKEVYLQAYNLLLLNKIIEKTEKIANVYAIEASDMLDRTMAPARQNRARYAPIGEQ